MRLQRFNAPANVTKAISKLEAMTTLNAKWGESDSAEVIAMEIAAQPICRKPSKAEAAPALCPKDSRVTAVPKGLIRPIPIKNTVNAAEK